MELFKLFISYKYEKIYEFVLSNGLYYLGYTLKTKTKQNKTKQNKNKKQGLVNFENYFLFFQLILIYYFLSSFMSLVWIILEKIVFLI